ncbi:group I truncated hemoglobin [Roseobacter sp. S98]|uniref:group I truncated hemoglobin n=1 Tax=Roseobacter algicola (ex Choi et al. 2025) (nom. illeg.) TaxID=3092138 RepID=UPI0035C735E7
MSSTFQKYGGFGTVSRVVLSFYEMVLDSDIVGHHFDDVDMARLMDHQTKFVSALMGGPSAMTDDRLAHVHHALDISAQEFDEVVRLLGEAMREHGMADADIRDVAREFEARRGCILRPGVR